MLQTKTNLKKNNRIDYENSNLEKKKPHKMAQLL